jgi:hypothetical protein
MQDNLSRTYESTCLTLCEWTYSLHLYPLILAQHLVEILSVRFRLVGDCPMTSLPVV